MVAAVAQQRSLPWHLAFASVAPAGTAAAHYLYVCLILLPLGFHHSTQPKPNQTQVTENFKYLPFGGGRRKCIGDQFALFETIVTLAMLLRRYNFELAPGKPEVGMTTGVRVAVQGCVRVLWGGCC